MSEKSTGQMLQIIIEPEEEYGGFAENNTSAKIIRSAKDAFDDLAKLLGDVSENLKATFENSGADEVQLGMNLSLEAGGNWAIISGKVGATATVTLTWNKK